MVIITRKYNYKENSITGNVKESLSLPQGVSGADLDFYRRGFDGILPQKI